MAVAVKHNQDTSSAGVLDRLPVALFMGVLYVFGSIGIVFPLLNGLWWHYVFTDRTNPVAWIGLLTAQTVAAGVLIWLGLVLLGKKPTRGLTAGIAVTSVALGLLALLGLYLGRAVEEILYANRWFGVNDPTAGLIITGVLVGVLLLALAYWVVQPSTEKFFGNLEDQGWFSLASYKRNQGQRVRRGTIIGILLVVGFGLRSLVNTLERDPGNWVVPVPFTDTVRVTAYTAGDLAAAPTAPEWLKGLSQAEWQALNAEALRLQALIGRTPKLATLKPQAERFATAAQKQENLDAARRQMTDLRQAIADHGGSSEDPVAPAPGGADIFHAADRFALRDLNRGFTAEYVKIKTPGSTGTVERAGKQEFTAGEVVPVQAAENEKTKREDTRKELKAAERDDQADLIVAPEWTEVKGATGAPHYDMSLILLPTVQYTLPALLALLTVWFAWRIVNFPTFADFLIATEAELNKVSWVTRRQLTQDTIVVLVTVVLMTVFLLFADIGWSQFLKGIGVLHSGPTREQQEAKELKW